MLMMFLLTYTWLTLQRIIMPMVGWWPAHGKPYSYKTYAWRRASNHSAIRFCINLGFILCILSTIWQWSISASTTDILTYEAWRQSKDAREIISRNFSLNIDDLFTLLFTNSKFFYDFQVIFVFYFSQLEFCHEIPISKWIPSDRRNERRQTLFNAPGSTATNLKTSSER